jgi:ankyrin repeat protein
VCYQGDVEQVEALADGGADVNQAGHSDVTSLHIAAMCGHLEIARVLYAHGAQLDVGDIVKFSPLHIACYFGHEKASLNALLLLYSFFYFLQFFSSIFLMLFIL